MEQTKVSIPADVLDGLEAVRLSGRTNMLDANEVIRLAMEMGHHDTAFWVYDHTALYVVGVFGGFEARGGEGECAD